MHSFHYFTSPKENPTYTNKNHYNDEHRNYFYHVDRLLQTALINNAI